jgi:hypothetical protein
MGKKCWVRGLRFSGIFRSLLTVEDESEALAPKVDDKLLINVERHTTAEISNVKWRQPKIMQP